MTQQPSATEWWRRGKSHHSEESTASAPRSFSSDEGDFDEWISLFESVSAVNGWTDIENLLWIRVRLTGKAHVAYARLPHVTLQTYAAIKGALYERFEPDSKRELYKSSSRVAGSKVGRVGQISVTI